MSFEIISVRGHYEAYDEDGNFICSGDKESETRQDAEEILTEGR